MSAEPDGNDGPRALLAVYDDALPVVYGYFVRRCADRGTAEDLTSDTFLAAMDAARKEAPPPFRMHMRAEDWKRCEARPCRPTSERGASRDCAAP